MRLAYSDHAIDQMRARDIGFSLVEDAVRKAAVTFDDKARAGQEDERVVFQTATMRVTLVKPKKDGKDERPIVVTVAWREEG